MSVTAEQREAAIVAAEHVLIRDNPFLTPRVMTEAMVDAAFEAAEKEEPS